MMNTTTALAAGLDAWLVAIGNTLAWTALLSGYALFAWEMSDEPAIVWEVEK